MSKKSPKTMTDQLRQAIDESGLTRYRISKDTGIDESTLAKFYNRRRGLSQESIDRLWEYLGLRVVVDEKTGKER